MPNCMLIGRGFRLNWTRHALNWQGRGGHGGGGNPMIAPPPKFPTTSDYGPLQPQVWVIDMTVVVKGFMFSISIGNDSNSVEGLFIIK
jgi:hypothetical protein